MTRKTNADLQAEVQQLKQEIEMLKAQDSGLISWESRLRDFEIRWALHADASSVAMKNHIADWKTHWEEIHNLGVDLPKYWAAITKWFSEIKESVQLPLLATK